MNLKLQLYTIARNIFYKTLFGKRLKGYQERNDKKIIELRMTLVKLHRPDLTAEANFILEHGLTQYPYKKIKEIDSVEAGYDKHYKLPYVVHKGKRLYYPKSKSIKSCVWSYTYFVGTEAILGDKYMEKHPHQYQSDNCKIEEGDILVDVGCGEALMALDNIEKVSKVYLFESNPKWNAPLKATFEKYNNKVVIINKIVSDKDTDNSIKLETALQKELGKKMFIKMDIEGAEIGVLRGNYSFIENNKNIKLAVCTYHRQNDAEDLYSLFEKLGYHNEFSDGYMYMSQYDKNDSFPYFRKGLIRCWI